MQRVDRWASKTDEPSATVSFEEIYRVLEREGLEGSVALEARVAPDWWRFLRNYMPYLSLPAHGITPCSQFLSLAEAHGGESPLTAEARAWLAREGPSHWWMRDVWPPAQPRWLPMVLEGHEGWVLAADLSSDGRFAVSGSKDCTARIWDARTGDCRAVIRHQAEVTAVRISSDDRLAVTGDGEGRLTLCDLHRGEAIACQMGHSDCVTVLRKVGEAIFSASNDGSMALWEPRGGRLLSRLRGHRSGVWQADVANDRVLSASFDGTLRVWNLRSGECLRELEGHEKPRAVSLSRDGRRGLSAGHQEARVWDLDSGRCLWTGQVSKYGTRPAAITPDGGRAVLAEHWGFRVIDIDRGILLSEGPRGGWPVVVTPDGNRAVTGHNLDTLLLHELELTPEGVTELAGHHNWVQALELRADGRMAISGGMDRTLRIWDLENPDHCPHPKDGLPLDSLLAADASGTWAASDALVELRLWEVSTGALRYQLRDHHFSVRDVAFGTDARTLVTVSGDHEPRVWDLATGSCRLVLEGHMGSCHSVAIDPDNRNAVSTSDDATLRVWDLVTGVCRRILEGHAGSVHTVELACAGQFALSGGSDSTIRVWCLESGQCLRVLKGHSGTISSMVVSPDGMRILSCGQDGLRLWDTECGRMLAVLGDGWVSTLAISGDGRCALTSDDDGRLKLWDLDEARLLRDMPGSGERLSGAGLFAEDNYAYTLDIAKILRIWNLRSGECLAARAGVGSALAVGDQVLVRAEAMRLRRLALLPPGRYPVLGSAP